MKQDKKAKFTILMIFIISLSFLLTSVMIVFKSGTSDMNTSYINKDKWSFIQPNFYKSERFDDKVLPSIVQGIEIELYGDSNINSYYGYYESNSLDNIKFIAIDKSTSDYITNTKYTDVDEFERNTNSYVNISVNNASNTYIKKVGDEEKKININYYSNISNINNNMELYLSIPKKLNEQGSLYGEYYMYTRAINLVKNYFFIGLVSSILCIISAIVCKLRKVDIITKESKILKYYSKIPLEFIIGLLILLFDFINDNETYYYIDFLSSTLIIIANFIFIFCIVMFKSEFKYFDKKTDILKTSFIIKNLINAKYIIVSSIKSNNKMSIIRKIAIIGIGCVILNLLSLFWGIEAVSIVMTITMICFTSYILKKLNYINEIIEGSERIKSGDLNYKIPIIEDDNLKILAENINNIGQGLENSIEDTLKSERMKTELITNVSHDLKTPLTSIINYIQLIKKEENIQPSYINDYINVLDSKSKRLNILIEDLFEASKASSGNIELNMEKIDLKQLLIQSIGEMEEKLLETRLEIKLNAPKEKVYIYADGRRMFRVFENLLSNIVKYSLERTRVYIDLSVDDGNVNLTMKNISSYELNFDPVEIMERFKRADESRNTEGSGLGLAIARDLVNLQGGNFKIEIDGDLFKSILEFNEIN